MTSVDAQVEALARTVIGIADPAMRAAYVRHTLLGMPPEQVADCFMLAMSSAESRRPAHSELLQAISLAFADDACNALRNEVRSVLEVRGQVSLARALTRFETDADGDPAAQRVPDLGKGRTVTLGERKSLARRHDRMLIARIVRDPHPQVIRILLGNPAVTEPDVVRLCAARPVLGEVLREVFRNPRWIVRYQVRIALLLNPYTPLDMALQIAPHVAAQDLRRVITAGDLHQELQDACRRLIGRTDTEALH
jgi:hypothetical protein